MLRARQLVGQGSDKALKERPVTGIPHFFVDGLQRLAPSEHAELQNQKLVKRQPAMRRLRLCE